ncbi:MAG: protein kinase domain-containing protein [Polyangiales bacterium]
MSNKATEEEGTGAETIGSPESGEQQRQLSARDFPIGLIIDGKYQVESILGQGGMGIVVAAKHVQLKERVALKFLRVEQSSEDTGGFKSRFRREAQIAAKIRNEHITRVIDVGVWKDTEFMVMEHLDGKDLRQVMRASPAGGMDVARAVDFAMQACEGLAEVHARGVVHRDLKPSNLFVVPRSDGGELIKILDFGISKWVADMDVQDDELTKTGAVLGSPKYMAPEQLFGSNSVDARADVWSVGAITYEMVTGRPPFDEPTFARLCARLASGTPPKKPREHRPDLSEQLEAAIMLCLEPNLDQRIPNVAALAGELLAAVGDEFAEPLRQRLQLVLDGGIPVSTTGTNPSLMRSGSYVAHSLSLSRTGSASGSKSAAAVLAATGETAVAPAPEKKSRGGIIAVAVVLLLAGLFFVFRRGQATEHQTPAPTGSATESAKAQPSIAATSATNTATSAPTSAVPAPASTSASAAPTKAVVQPVIKKNGTVKTAEPPPPTATTAAPPPPPPPPPATTTAKPNNPLEDRQ